MQLGKVYALQSNYQAAIAVYLEALKFSPDNAEVLTTIGLLYLRMGENLKAFDFLGNSLSKDPRSVKTILAAASVIQASCIASAAAFVAFMVEVSWENKPCKSVQDHHDMDVALVKYRVAAVQMPNSPQLWNNIGMRRALNMAPDADYDDWFVHMQVCAFLGSKNM